LYFPLAFSHPGSITAEAKHGEVTLARFDGDNGEYSMLLGKAKGVDGPKGMGTYLWVEVENIKRLEAKIVEGPYIHHCVGIHKDVVPVLYEACKYMGITPDLYDPIEEDVKKEYVLIYEIHNNPRLDDYAKRFAAHVGLPLVRVSPTFHQLARGGRFVFCPEIGTFLSYIKNARYMLTDSFHGTAFAINFHTPFLEVLPNNKTGARNQSILQLTGLEDRIVTDFNDFSLADRQIDYAKVNEIMHRERERSMEKLAELCECQM